jgi:hypothetical protein
MGGVVKLVLLLVSVTVMLMSICLAGLKLLVVIVPVELLDGDQLVESITITRSSWSEPLRLALGVVAWGARLGLKLEASDHFWVVGL